MVGEELEGDDGEEGLEGFDGFGDGEDVVGDGVDVFVAFGGDGDDFSAAGFDFLDVAEDFFVLGAAGRDEDDGHAGVDEGDGAVFHFRGGEAFGVDVADFLEFECAFEGDGVVVAATEEEPVVAVDVLFGDALDFVGLFEYASDLVGDFAEAGEEFIEHLLAHVFAAGDEEG